MEDSEFLILDNVVRFMEKEGVIRDLVSFSIDEKLVNEIYELSGKQFSIADLKKAADVCLAHEWIRSTVMGQKYQRLAITEKGVGIVRSKRKQEIEKKSRTLLKKTSDYIEEHKGLVTVIVVALSVLTLIAKLKTGG